MNNQIKRWYFILSAIWAMFWIVDILFLVPSSNTIVGVLKDVFTDPLMFSISWIIVTIPYQFYLIYLGCTKVWNFVRVIIKKFKLR